MVKNKNFIQRMHMSIEDLSEYYMIKRKERFDEGVPLKGIKLRKIIHFIPLFLVKIDRRLEKEKITVINDERTKYRYFNEKPTIFACSHFGGNDIHRVFETIKANAYLMFGDPVGTYKDIVGLMLVMNGAINLETRNKEDRKIAKARSVELLNNGGNLLIFPEGAWNLSPNLLVMDLYKGAVSIARETGADIVPIAVEEYDKNYIVSIGKTIDIESKKDMSIEELNLYLRDCIATEKWRIFESRGMKTRDGLNIDPKEFEKFIVNKCGYGYTVEDVYETKYIDKDKVTKEEVFSHLDDLNINSNNAFLLNKRHQY